MIGVPGRGALGAAPARRTRLIAALAALWLALTVTLVGWWAVIVLRQAARIAQLEGPSDAATAAWARTRLMLLGESAVFGLLLLGLTAALAWLYWREQRRVRALQAFFAAVTHELRTPLTSIRLQAEAIAEGDQRAELARRLLEDALRLGSQIDKTLELARIEGGGPLAEQAVPLQGWMERTLAGIAQAYGERVEIKAHLPADLPAVSADASALQMILRNLVENSVRHGRVEPVRVRITALVRDAQVVLEYQDNGAGTADAAQLGQLFNRGPQSSGAGVGLYLVSRLMERMHGHAVFCSSPGDGFRAELRLRAAAGE
ncbi:MAG: HAMP domain-containing histidine kinase [Gammaproteobacteria bacterium]|nr:HAMP domain-containing histidine kinase [Gammaproteobacteria bacterium]